MCLGGVERHVVAAAPSRPHRTLMRNVRMAESACASEVRSEMVSALPIVRWRSDRTLPWCGDVLNSVERVNSRMRSALSGCVFAHRFVRSHTQQYWLGFLCIAHMFMIMYCLLCISVHRGHFGESALVCNPVLILTTDPARHTDTLPDTYQSPLKGPRGSHQVRPVCVTHNSPSQHTASIRLYEPTHEPAFRAA